MIREKVKELWRLCFNDTEDFIDRYFRLRYNNEVNIAIQSGEELIAALQMLPYPMTYNGKEIKTSYISGACTHPDYRNRGVMHELLSQAFAQMLHKDTVLSTLIPAEPWLFGYYARSGYVPVFNYQTQVFNTFQVPLPQEVEATFKADCESTDEYYEYLNRKLRERPNCIQHTKDDFQFILLDLQASHGKIYTLNQEEKGIVAMGIAYPTENGGWYLAELISDTPQLESTLLQRICEKNHLSSIEIHTPLANDTGGQLLGMARIINAQKMLQLYATANPELEINLSITDEQISVNSGYYYLSNGKCRSSANRLPGGHLSLTIGELTEKVFAALNPYMSLMMN